MKGMKRFFILGIVFFMFFLCAVSSVIAGGPSQISLEELALAQKSKVNYVKINLWNQDKDYCNGSYVSTEEVTLSIEDVEPGSYYFSAYAEQRTEDSSYTLFSDEGIVIIKPGENPPIEVNLTLNIWQPVSILLPDVVEGEIEFTVCGNYNEGNGFCAGFYPLEDGKTLTGQLPINLKGAASLKYNGRAYYLNLNSVFLSIVNGIPLDLASCASEPITKFSAEIGFAENYIMIPGDYDDLQQAIDSAEPGDTVKLQYGYYTGPDVYNGQIYLKAGVNIEGNKAYPYQVVIYSDNNFTLLTGGINKISGVTIQSNYTGTGTSAAVVSTGSSNFESCIFELSEGVEGIIVNTGTLRLKNVTIAGEGENTGVVGSAKIDAERVIFNNLLYAFSVESGDVSAEKCLFNVGNVGNTASMNDCIFGDPLFQSDYWRRFTPIAGGPADLNKQGHIGAVIPYYAAPYGLGRR